MIINPGNQAVPSVPVDPVAVAVRGNSNPVRSDIPPVQSGEGVRYTRGRPTDDEDVDLVYVIKRKAPRQGEEEGEKQQSGSRERDTETPERRTLTDAAEVVDPPVAEWVTPQVQGALPPEDTSIIAQMRQRHASIGLGDPLPPEDSEVQASVLRVVPGPVFAASYKPRDQDPAGAVEVLV